MSTKPNFFILGAPKAGTTALSEYLGSHPEILFSKPKEPKFFNTDFKESHRFALSLEDYLKCFGDRTDNYPAVGEGTVWYLYSQVAVANILDFNPAARFIVMLRNPIDLVHSLHSQLLFGGEEDIESFERAWRLQDRRAEGRNLPRYCTDSKIVQYGRVGRLGEQLDRLYRLVPEDRVLTILFEDFSRDTPQVYRKTLDFLDLPPDSGTDFKNFNPNKVVRWRRALRPLYAAWSLKTRMGIKRSFGLWRALTPMLTVERPRRPLSDPLRMELRDYFRTDIELLSQLLRRDLSSWT